MTYLEYIESPAWKIKRNERLVFDAGLCVICRNPATSVHHLRYPSEFGKEDIQHDLASVCELHHRLLDNLERWQRYSHRDRRIDTVATVVSLRNEVNCYGLARNDLPTVLGCPAPDAQRTDSQPRKQVGEIVETDLLEAHQDRQRL